MAKFSRRRFLSTSSNAAFAAAVTSLVPGTGVYGAAAVAGKPEFHFDGGDWLLAGHSHGGKQFVRVARPVPGTQFTLEVPALIHQCLMQRGTTRAFAIPRLGRSFYVIDIEAQALARAIEQPDGHYFYGHGALSRDGKYLALSEADFPTGRGWISIRDTADLKVLERFSTGGLTPHECHFSDDGSQLSVLNSGMIPSAWMPSETKPTSLFRWTENSSLVTLELKSGRALDRVVFDAQGKSFGHLLRHGDFIAVAASPAQLKDKGQLLMGKLGSALRIAQAPGPLAAGFTGQYLSLAHDPTHDILAVTHPDAGAVSFWNGSTGAFLKSIELAGANGICAPCPGYFALSQAKSRNVTVINSKTLGARDEARFLCGNGAHLSLFRARAT